MIVTRAPFRVSLFGGGTDFENYYRSYPSKILSFAIDKYIYVIVKKRDDNLIYVNYSRKEITNKLSSLKHELVKESLKYFKIYRGVEISIISDIPSKGSGLGSSSALTNALILAISLLQGKKLTQKEICKIAIDIEIKILKKPIGIQDQYGTAFGGLKIISMSKKKISIKKVLNQKLKRAIEQNSIIYDTRKNRKAEEVLSKQKKLIKKNILELNILNKISRDIINNIDQLNINVLIEKLNQSWNVKKNLEKNISNLFIEKKINFLKKRNFQGFKLCGAGKGGFIYALSDKKINFKNNFSKRIKIDKDGVKLIFINK